MNSEYFVFLEQFYSERIIFINAQPFAFIKTCFPMLILCLKQTFLNFIISFGLLAFK